MTTNYTPAERWKYLANIRQGIISKLEKKLDKAEAENLALRTSLTAANARLALYDAREAA
jgi:hypothetical protein